MNNNFGPGGNNGYGCFPNPQGCVNGGRGPRDCLHGPSSTGSFNGMQGFFPGYGPTPSYTAYQPQRSRSQQTGYYSQPRAFMQVPGRGQGSGASGELLPLQIPCQMQMGSTGQMPSMQPLTIKLTAPPGSGANGAPIAFKLDPSIWMNAAQRK